MTSKAKLALIAAVAAVSVVSPALAQAGVHHVRRNGLHAYAMEPHSAPRARMPVDSDDPALTGGGSIGYNELLRQEGN